MPERLKDVEYVIEANSFEQLQLWKMYSKEAKGAYLHVENEFVRRFGWINENDGYLQIVGNIKTDESNFPVCISISFAKLDGVNVMFFYSTGQVSHHGMIDKWLEKNCNPMSPGRRFKTDAMNFSHAISYIRRKQEEAQV